MYSLLFVPCHLSELVFDLTLTWSWTTRALGDLKRPRKSQRRLVWTIWGPKSQARGAKHRPQIGPKRLASLAGTTGQLSRFGVELMLMLGRCWVDDGVDVGLSWVDFESACLSVPVCHSDIRRPLPNSTAWRFARSDKMIKKTTLP